MDKPTRTRPRKGRLVKVHPEEKPRKTKRPGPKMKNTAEPGSQKCGNRECSNLCGQDGKPRSIYCCKRCQSREQNLRQGRIKSAAVIPKASASVAKAPQKTTVNKRPVGRPRNSESTKKRKGSAPKVVQTVSPPVKRRRAAQAAAKKTKQRQRTAPNRPSRKGALRAQQEEEEEEVDTDEEMGYEAADDSWHVKRHPVTGGPAAQWPGPRPVVGYGGARVSTAAAQRPYPSWKGSKVPDQTHRSMVLVRSRSGHEVRVKSEQPKQDGRGVSPGVNGLTPSDPQRGVEITPSAFGMNFLSPLQAPTGNLAHPSHPATMTLTGGRAVQVGPSGAQVQATSGDIGPVSRSGSEISSAAKRQRHLPQPDQYHHRNTDAVAASGPVGHPQLPLTPHLPSHTHSPFINQPGGLRGAEPISVLMSPGGRLHAVASGSNRSASSSVQASPLPQQAFRMQPAHVGSAGIVFNPAQPERMVHPGTGVARDAGEANVVAGVPMGDSGGGSATRPLGQLLGASGSLPPHASPSGGVGTTWPSTARQGVTVSQAGGHGGEARPWQVVAAPALPTVTVSGHPGSLVGHYPAGPGSSQLFVQGVAGAESSGTANLSTPTFLLASASGISGAQAMLPASGHIQTAYLAAAGPGQGAELSTAGTGPPQVTSKAAQFEGAPQSVRTTPRGTNVLFDESAASAAAEHILQLSNNAQGHGQAVKAGDDAGTTKLPLQSHGPNPTIKVQGQPQQQQPQFYYVVSNQAPAYPHQGSHAVLAHQPQYQHSYPVAGGMNSGSARLSPDMNTQIGGSDMIRSGAGPESAGGSASSLMGGMAHSGLYGMGSQGSMPMGLHSPFDQMHHQGISTPGLHSAILSPGALPALDVDQKASAPQLSPLYQQPGHCQASALPGHVPIPPAGQALQPPHSMVVTGPGSGTALQQGSGSLGTSVHGSIHDPIEGPSFSLIAGTSATSATTAIVADAPATSQIPAEVPPTSHDAAPTPKHDSDTVLIAEDPRPPPADAKGRVSSQPSEPHQDFLRMADEHGSNVNAASALPVDNTLNVPRHHPPEQPPKANPAEPTVQTPSGAASVISQVSTSSRSSHGTSNLPTLGTLGLFNTRACVGMNDPTQNPLLPGHSAASSNRLQSLSGPAKATIASGSVVQPTHARAPTDGHIHQLASVPHPGSGSSRPGGGNGAAPTLGTPETDCSHGTTPRSGAHSGSGAGDLQLAMSPQTELCTIPQGLRLRATPQPMKLGESSQAKGAAGGSMSAHAKSAPITPDMNRTLDA